MAQLGGWHREEESWWGAEWCKANLPGTESATFLVPEQKKGEMPAPVRASMRTGLWALVHL